MRYLYLKMLVIRRKSFFKRIGLLSAISIAALKGWSNVFHFDTTTRGFLVRSGQDRFNKPITLLEGDTFFTKVSSRDTNGSLYIFESTRVKKGGPSRHFHYDQDEI